MTKHICNPELMSLEFNLAQLSQIFFQMTAVAASEQAITDEMRNDAKMVCTLIMKRMLTLLGVEAST